MTDFLGTTPHPPTWYILQCKGGREKKLAQSMRDANLHACYPIRETFTKRNCKRTIVKRAQVPGYVFVRFDRLPHWHILKARQLITGVVCRDTQYGPVPYEATTDDVRAFMGLETEAEKLAAARAEAMRVKPGDVARVLLPNEMELAVTVKAVSNGRVFWEAGPIKGDTVEERVVKDA